MIVGMATNLLTLGTLAKWTQGDAAAVASDPFAKDLIAKVSELVCFIGGHPDWTLDEGVDKAPIDVQMVVLQVCKRSYENPGQVIQETIGPLSERVTDLQALFMDFTEAERRTISKYNPDGDPTAQEGAGQVFTMPTTRGAETTLPQTSPLYVGDNMQVGLAESADPREWMIPLLNPGDPGDDANYV